MGSAASVSGRSLCAAAVFAVDARLSLSPKVMLCVSLQEVG